MSNSFGRNSNFRVLRLTTIFRGSFETICCILAADRKSALRSSTFSQCCASCQQRISNLRCFHSELLVSPEVYWSTSSPTLMERSRCCAGAQAKTCAGHKQTPSTHLPDTNPVKDSGRVRCWHLYVKPAVLSKIDLEQFGTVPKSSTTHASISMTHSWAKSTDGNHEKTHRACTVSIPVSSIQFLIICYRELYGAFQETFLH